MYKKKEKKKKPQHKAKMDIHLYDKGIQLREKLCNLG